ncbi:PilZ domain-containing protein [Novosphingobium resinovorum]|uniref:PilZ domain-containing protein n=1 Tax=Novosphingobium resinovorum TaxID=158500 RepID=UPI002ED3185A|nr:PilZ domain-containing protein [Novosphingobium resinovorum]
MTDIDDFASSERPEWLRALARRAAPSSDETAATPERPHRAPRVRTLIRAVIGGEGRTGEDVIVRNVSPGGMCIASRTLLPSMGEMLRVSLPGQADLQAQVRWVGKGEFGVLLTGGLDVNRIQATNRQRNAGFGAALERLLGVRPQETRGSAGTRAC